MKKEVLRGSIIEGVDDKTLHSNTFINLNDMDDVEKIKPAILLHSCCGPCSTSVVERLSGRYNITIFFFNPNITDKEEYLKRRTSQIDFIDKYNGRRNAKDRITFLEGPYDPEVFYQAAANLEQEPEGGKRCTACFQLRLEKTAETASISGFDCFGTTLTVSPHKNFELINKIGMKLGMRYGLTFLSEDFKKRAGFQRSIELSKEYNLYRQHYCGCSFSNNSETL